MRKLIEWLWFKTAETDEIQAVFQARLKRLSKDTSCSCDGVATHCSKCK